MSGRSQRVIVLAVFSGLALLVAAIAPRLFVVFDEAYNLNISLNRAQSAMYATQIGDWFRPVPSHV